LVGRGPSDLQGLLGRIDGLYPAHDIHFVGLHHDSRDGSPHHVLALHLARHGTRHVHVVVHLQIGVVDSGQDRSVPLQVLGVRVHPEDGIALDYLRGRKDLAGYVHLGSVVGLGVGDQLRVVLVSQRLARALNFLGCLVRRLATAFPAIFSIPSGGILNKVLADRALPRPSQLDAMSKMRRDTDR